MVVVVVVVVGFLHHLRRFVDVRRTISNSIITYPRSYILAPVSDSLLSPPPKQ